MTDNNLVKVLAVDALSELSPISAAALVAEFSGGQSLEITWQRYQGDPCPPSVQVWGGRMPRKEGPEEEEINRTCGISIMPCANNLVTVQPYRHGSEAAIAVPKMYAVDDGGQLSLVVAESLVLALSNSQSLEIAWRHQQAASIALYGGRMPRQEWPFDEVRKRTQAVALFPLAGNVVHVHPYRLPALDQKP